MLLWSWQRSVPSNLFDDPFNFVPKEPLKRIITTFRKRFPRRTGQKDMFPRTQSPTPELEQHTGEVKDESVHECAQIPCRAGPPKEKGLIEQESHLYLENDGDLHIPELTQLMGADVSDIELSKGEEDEPKSIKDNKPGMISAKCRRINNRETTRFVIQFIMSSATKLS